MEEAYLDIITRTDLIFNNKPFDEDGSEEFIVGFPSFDELQKLPPCI